MPSYTDANEPGAFDKNPVNRTIRASASITVVTGVLTSAVTAIGQRLSRVTGQSARTLLLSATMLGLALSWAVGFVLAAYYSVDVISSLFNPPQDCWLDWGMRIGRHCFSDYPVTVGEGMRPNPWEPYPMFLPWVNYQPDHTNPPAAGMLPFLLIGLPFKWLGAPQLGLLCALLVLTIAVLAPAVWAARAARGLEKVVVFVACGAAA